MPAINAIGGAVRHFNAAAEAVADANGTLRDLFTAGAGKAEASETSAVASALDRAQTHITGAMALLRPPLAQPRNAEDLHNGAALLRYFGSDAADITYRTSLGGGHAGRNETFEQVSMRLMGVMQDASSAAAQLTAR